MEQNKVISEEGQGHPRNNYARASTMGGGLIINEATAAHLQLKEFCLEWEKTSLPNEPEEFKFTSYEQKMWACFYAWKFEYKESQSKLYAFQWWELKPIEEMMSMLLELPLSPDTYEEIVELIKALKFMGP